MKTWLKWVNPRRDSSRSPIFDVAFVMENFESGSQSMGGEAVFCTTQGGKHPLQNLTSHCMPLKTGGSVQFRIEYCMSLFKPENHSTNVRSFHQHYSSCRQRTGNGSGDGGYAFPVRKGAIAGRVQPGLRGCARKPSPFTVCLKRPRARYPEAVAVTGHSGGRTLNPHLCPAGPMVQPYRRIFNPRSPRSSGGTG